MVDAILARVRQFPQATDVEADDPLFTSGRLDSIEMTRLDVWLERTFGISLDFGDLHTNATDTVEQIARMVARKLERAAPARGR